MKVCSFSMVVKGAGKLGSEKIASPVHGPVNVNVDDGLIAGAVRLKKASISAKPAVAGFSTYPRDALPTVIVPDTPRSSLLTTALKKI